MESSSAKRPDRKTVERNRRIHMKMLYSQLHSLVPSPRPTRERRSAPLPDRLDETVSYIKGLQEKIERMKDKKCRLLEGETARSSQGTSRSAGGGTSTVPHIEVRDLGMALQVMIASSSVDWFVFKEAIRIIVEEGFEICNANLSVVAGWAFHTIHLQVGELKGGQEAAKLLGRLKKEMHLLLY